MIDYATFHQIHHLHDTDHLNQAQIATALNLDEKTVESYARVQFEGKRPAFEAKSEKIEDARRVLKNYLNADGTLKQIPAPGRKQLIILNFIVEAFADKQSPLLEVVRASGKLAHRRDRRHLQLSGRKLRFRVKFADRIDRVPEKFDADGQRGIG